MRGVAYEMDSGVTGDMEDEMKNIGVNLAEEANIRVKYKLGKDFEL